WTIHARWYLESNGTITPDVRVVIMDGSIQEIQRDVSAQTDDLQVDLLLPGLINAHCHLEYSHLAGVLSGGNLPFGEWLSSIMAQRSTPCTPERMAEAVDELIRGGCTLVCDSSTDGASASVLRELAMPHVIYREVLGLTPDRAAANW